MFESIWKDVREFSNRNTVTRLIAINVIVFLGINLLYVILRVATSDPMPDAYVAIRNSFAVSSEWLQNLIHPWGIFTSMILHEGFWHIFWNMILFYMFGRIVGDLLGDRRILPLYLLGGLAGNLIFFLSVNLLPYGGGIPHYALGASGAVMAVAMAAGATAPDYYIRLILLGSIKLKYIVAVLLLLDIISIGRNINTGGHFAHLGGALMGYLFATQLRRGNDLSEPVNNILERISSFFRGIVQERGRKRPGPKVSYRNPNRRSAAGNNRRDGNNSSHQEELDAILDKIKERGYNSLTQEEKDFLFKASNKD